MYLSYNLEYDWSKNDVVLLCMNKILPYLLSRKFTVMIFFSDNQITSRDVECWHIYESSFATTQKSWFMSVVDSICILIKYFTFIWRNVEWWLRRRAYKSKYAQNHIHFQTFQKMPWDVKGKKTHEMRIVHNNSLLSRATITVYRDLYIFYRKDISK